MNLSKHDPETDMEMNMTPMIDVVFLLIIFFMIITDMSQQDLEELTLPVAERAVEDKPDPKDNRPIVNIPFDGKIIVKREPLYDPEDPDGYKELKIYLAAAAELMPKEPLNEDGTGPKVPDTPLLIRADESTPFKHIQKVMEACGEKGIQIWKVQLAVSVPDENNQQ